MEKIQGKREFELQYFAEKGLAETTRTSGGVNAPYLLLKVQETLPGPYLFLLFGVSADAKAQQVEEAQAQKGELVRYRQHGGVCVESRCRRSQERCLHYARDFCVVLVQTMYCTAGEKGVVL